MSRGGARPGAGRKPGPAKVTGVQRTSARIKRTKKANSHAPSIPKLAFAGTPSADNATNIVGAETAIIRGPTPLVVILKAMHVHYGAKRWDKAAAIAKLAAPYVHPRYTAIDQLPDGPLPTDVGEPDRLPILELARRIAFVLTSAARQQAEQKSNEQSNANGHTTIDGVNSNNMNGKEKSNGSTTGSTGNGALGEVGPGAHGEEE